MDIKETLKERQGSHGEFTDNSELTERIMDILRAQPQWKAFPSFAKSGIYFIVHKLSRAICGNINYKDHWHDIEGYARLVKDRVDG